MCWRCWAFMPNVLQGLHVAVTRPAHQAAGFRQALEQAGAIVIPLPLIAIHPPDNSAAIALVVSQLPRYDTAIFISTNAVEYGLQVLSPAQHATLHQLTLGAIGKRTAQVLQAYGFMPDWVPTHGFTSEDFLALPQTQDVAGRRVLIFRGQGGRELLADTLRERGAQVTYLDVYQRICVPVDASHLKYLHEQRQLDIITFTSSEGLLNLLSLLDNPDWIKTVPLLVGSQRMCATARNAGWTGTIRIADNPSDEAMLRALKHWVQEFHA